MATATKNRSHAAQHETEEAEFDGLPEGLKLTFTEDEEKGRTVVVIEGRAEVEINEIIDPQTGEPRFVSPAFNKPQETLKGAVEWVGRNTVTRAFRAAWAEAHPNEGMRSNGRTSAAAATAAKIDKLEAMMAALMKQMGSDHERGSKG